MVIALILIGMFWGAAASNPAVSHQLDKGFSWWAFIPALKAITA